MRIIAGPCQHETYTQSLEIAKECKRVCDLHGVEYIFKASYDKANRSSVDSERGVGMDSTLTDLKMIKFLQNIDILTDVHTVEQIDRISNWYGDVVDVLQIPAFLCRQTDLVVAACQTGKVVNIKKGQFLAPWDVKNILSKTVGAKDVWITERGTSFGYNSLVVDFTGLQYMMENYDNPIVFDVTHSVQKPGGLGSASGGNRDYVAGLARSGSALGVENFFLEVHQDPDNAPSDGPNTIKLDQFEKTVEDIVRYSFAINK